MTSTNLLTKSRLTKLFGRRTSDGYVELVAATDRGFFDLRRAEVAFRGSDAGPTSDFAVLPVHADACHLPWSSLPLMSFGARGVQEGSQV